MLSALAGGYITVDSGLLPYRKTCTDSQWRRLAVSQVAYTMCTRNANSKRQDGGLGYRQAWDDRKSLDRVKHKGEIPGKDRDHAVGRGVPRDPWTQGSSGDGRVVLQ